MRKATSINDLINETSYKEVSMNINDDHDKRQQCGKRCGKLGISTEVADFKAQILINKFNAPQCRLFFLKCIYHLPEYKIQQAIDAAMRPGIKSRIKYFVACANKELKLIGQ